MADHFRELLAILVGPSLSRRRADYGADEPDVGGVRETNGESPTSVAWLRQTSYFR